MAALYTTLEKVQKSYMGTWEDSWDEWVTDQIPVVSAMLRKQFRKYNRDLDDDILTGDPELILVEEVANNMIIRRLKPSDNELPAVDFSNLSQSVGPYSFSVGGVNSSSSFYLKRDELRLLGLPLLATGNIDFVYFTPERRGDVFPYC